MIPLDRNFNDLLNVTIPFPLPKVDETTVAKVVPTRAVTPEAIIPKTPVVPKPAHSVSQNLDEPNSVASIPISSNVFNCTNNSFNNHYDASCGTSDSQADPETATSTESAVTKTESDYENKTENVKPLSKVEISAERAVRFEIDPSMVINRPRLTLKDSGLPIPLTPVEPDPSIVGESVLGFKSASSAKASSKEVISQGQEIPSEISSEMLELLERQSVISDKPNLKAFNPQKTTIEEQNTEAASIEREYDNTLNALLYNSSCELDDESDLIEDQDFIDKALLAEKERLAREAEAIEAYELADDVTEDDLAALESFEIVDSTEETTEDALAEEVTVEETSEETFYPMLQVDRFSWPKFCLDMHPIIKTQLGHLANQLIAKSEASGRKVMAIAGSGPGAGSSSILLGLATSLEAAGLKIAIIDANVKSPDLASCLGLQPEQGWETVLSGELPVEESLIDSIEDRIALLPLCLDHSQKLTFGVRPMENDRMNVAVQKLRDHYDMVLVDLGSPEPAGIAAFANMSEWIDSAVVVHNLRDASRAQLIQTKNLMRDYGISVAGIAENFAPRESCFDNDSSYRAA